MYKLAHALRATPADHMYISNYVCQFPIKAGFNWLLIVILDYLCSKSKIGWLVPANRWSTPLAFSSSSHSFSFSSSFSFFFFSLNFCPFLEKTQDALNRLVWGMERSLMSRSVLLRDWMTTIHQVRPGWILKKKKIRLGDGRLSQTTKTHGCRSILAVILEWREWRLKGWMPKTNGWPNTSYNLVTMEKTSRITSNRVTTNGRYVLVRCHMRVMDMSNIQRRDRGQLFQSILFAKNAIILKHPYIFLFFWNFTLTHSLTLITNER